MQQWHVYKYHQSYKEKFKTLDKPRTQIVAEVKKHQESKSKPPNSCPSLHQIFTDNQHSFTGGLVETLIAE